VQDGIRNALLNLRTRSTYDLYRLFEEELPPRPRLFFIFPLLALVSVLGILALFVSPGVGILVLTSAMCANLVIKLYMRPRYDHLVRPISALGAMVAAGEALVKLDSEDLRACVEGLAEGCKKLRWVKASARRLAIEDSGNELVASLAVWANLLFLLDVNAFVLSIERLRRSGEEMRSVFRVVGMVDALLAIGAFRRTLPVWCSPNFTPSQKHLRCEGLFHPLVTDPVLNDCHVDGRSLLVTGSNMAGKSTYLRAVGTCVVLAQTIATVPARSWVAPRLRVETLMGRNDDLQSGKSYFYAEAERVKDMLDLATGEEAFLFIVDELYRGTNTTERVAAAHAVLDQLNEAQHVCLVATHDVELLDLLGSGWDCWYFRETIDSNGVWFDYKARPGVATAPNALRLLERLNYPPSVVRRAFETYQILARSSDAKRPSEH
jgi:DNA mismatch repair ATPase MutS